MDGEAYSSSSELCSSSESGREEWDSWEEESSEVVVDSLVVVEGRSVVGTIEGALEDGPRLGEELAGQLKREAETADGTDA